MLRNRFPATVLLSLGITLSMSCERADKSRGKASAFRPAEESNSVHSTRASLVGRLKVAGVEDPEAALKFLKRLQGEVQSHDRLALIASVRFPFSRYDHGIRIRTYDCASELTPDFDLVFTSKVIHAVGVATFDSLFANWQGVMIGNGEIWFDSGDDGCKIIAVNPE